MSDLQRQQAADWRRQIRLNQRRTNWVILIFFLIYLGIGFILDVLLQTNGQPVNAASLSLAATNLLTFKAPPILTIIFGAIAAISLLITIKLHDKLMLLGTKYTEITAESTDFNQKQLYNVVEEMKVAAGLQYMPRVYIIDADYMNAFASGFSEKSAMVAITRGLMSKLNRAELQAVMAHELSHIRHQDIKLTLMASVLANLILIAIDLIFRGALYSNNERRKNNGAIIMVVMLLRIILPIITILLTLYLSRSRELMADAGAVELMRTGEPLGNALLKIHQDHSNNAATYQKAYQGTAHEDVRLQAYIYTPSYAKISATSTLSQLFSTHPSLETRLQALGFKQDNSQK